MMLLADKGKAAFTDDVVTRIENRLAWAKTVCENSTDISSNIQFYVPARLRTSLMDDKRIDRGSKSILATFYSQVTLLGNQMLLWK